MKRMYVAALLATALVFGITLESQANGGLFRRSKGCGSCCEAPCAPGCPPLPPLR